MTPADEIVLKALEPFMTDDAYAYVVEKTTEAGGIRNLTDPTATRQLDIAKRRFGGDRSAAASYAANARWKGKKEEFLTADNKGVKQRTAQMGGVDTQFDVKPIQITDIKTGDIVSLASTKTPQKVTAIAIKDGKAAIATQDLTSNSRYNSISPASGEARIWTPISQAPTSQKPSTSGRIDPSRKIDSSKITASDTAFINAGANGPERVRRRTQVIDTYASQGKDVSIPSSSGSKGGAQWLGTSGQ